jgi:predicted protein tyrosine phosphatase
MILFDTPRATKFGGFSRTAHLVSTRLGEAGHAELLAFASAIGLRRDWLQKPGTATEHFDLFDGAIGRARAAGAQEVPVRELHARVIWPKRHPWSRSAIVIGREEVQAVARAHPEWALLGIGGSDPGSLAGDVSYAAAFRGRRLHLWFDDIPRPRPGWHEPEGRHAHAIVAFARQLQADRPPGFVVYCAAGISRSSAAMLGILDACAAPDPLASLHAAVALAQERGWRDETPICPNPRLVALLDAELRRDGRLLRAAWPLTRERCSVEEFASEVGIPVREG